MSSEHAVPLPGAFFQQAAAARSRRMAALQAELWQPHMFRAMNRFWIVARGNYAARKQVEAFIRGIETAVFTQLFTAGSGTAAPPAQQAGFLQAMAVNRAFFARNPKAGEVRRAVLAALAANPQSPQVLARLSPAARDYVQGQLKMLDALGQLTWVDHPAF